MRFAVEGDLRFLSHHEMMRAIELAAVRADLPLAYSQGFNPHPVMSLVCPRPVAVASRDELLVVSLDCQGPEDFAEGSPPISADRLIAAMARQAPPGLRFLRAEPLAAKRPPRPVRIDYVLPLDEGQAGQLLARIEQLGQADGWPVDRLVSLKGGRGGETVSRTIDIRPLIRDLICTQRELRWSAVPCGDAWARPSDLLGLLGLDQRTTLARVIRTTIECTAPHGGAQEDNQEQ